jgi:RNA-directed DNA polymerase
LRKHARPNRKATKLRIPPSTASFRALKAKVRPLCQQARGATPEQLLDTLTPVLRGGANSPRYVLGGETCAQLANFVWQRVSRWAKRRHSDKTGCGSVDHYVPSRKGETRRFTAPATGKQLLQVRAVVNPQRSLKVKGEANPCDPAWAVYFQDRDRELALRASAPFRAKLRRHQHGLCPGCRQVIQVEEEVELHHREGNPQNHHVGNLVLFHPPCHRQEHYAPEHTPAPTRPSRGVGQA